MSPSSQLAALGHHEHLHHCVQPAIHPPNCVLLRWEITVLGGPVGRLKAGKAGMAGEADWKDRLLFRNGWNLIPTIFLGRVLFFSGSSQKLLSNWTLDIHCMYISLFVECKMKLARFFNGKIRNFILFATVITWGHLQPSKQYLGGANYGVINHIVSSCLT